jgi:hypothetical protein
MRRKPYLIIGWVLTFFVTIGGLIYSLTGDKLAFCYFQYNPPSEGGTVSKLYFKAEYDSAVCLDTNVYSMIEPDGLILGVVLLLQNIAYITADVSIDSMSIEWAQREHPKTRGRIQTNNYVSRALGFVLSALMIGFGMNSEPFGGDFSGDLGVAGVFAVQATVIACQFPFHYFFIEDRLGESEKVPMKEQFRKLLELCSDKAFGFLMLFNLVYGLMVYVNPKAASNVRVSWVDMPPLINSFNNVWGNVVAAVMIGVSGVYLTNWNWRILQGFSTVAKVFIGLLYIPIIYLGVRSPWYYIFVQMDDTAISYISYMVNMWAVNELSKKGLEGTAFSMCTTTNNVALTTASVFLTNAIGNPWPSLQKLTGPTAKDDYMRNYAVVSVIHVLSCFALPMLPNQKADAHRRREKWGSSTKFGIMILTLSAFVTLWALSTTIGSMFCPAHKVFGGDSDTC